MSYKPYRKCTKCAINTIGKRTRHFRKKHTRYSKVHYKHNRNCTKGNVIILGASESVPNTLEIVQGTPRRHSKPHRKHTNLLRNHTKHSRMHYDHYRMCNNPPEKRSKKELNTFRDRTRCPKKCSNNHKKCTKHRRKDSKCITSTIESVLTTSESVV